MLQRESGTSLGLPCEPAGGECPSSLLLGGSAVVLCDWKVQGLWFFSACPAAQGPTGSRIDCGGTAPQVHVPSALLWWYQG